MLKKIFLDMLNWGSFTNYVDKRRWIGGQKFVCFCQNLKGRKCQHGGKKGQNLKKNLFACLGNSKIWSALIYKWSLGIKAAKSKIVV